MDLFALVDEYWNDVRYFTVFKLKKDKDKFKWFFLHPLEFSCITCEQISAYIKIYKTFTSIPFLESHFEFDKELVRKIYQGIAMAKFI